MILKFELKIFLLIPKIKPITTYSIMYIFINTSNKVCCNPEYSLIIKILNKNYNYVYQVYYIWFI